MPVLKNDVGMEKSAKFFIPVDRSSLQNQFWFSIHHIFFPWVHLLLKHFHHHSVKCNTISRIYSRIEKSAHLLILKLLAVTFWSHVCHELSIIGLMQIFQENSTRMKSTAVNVFVRFGYRPLHILRFKAVLVIPLNLFLPLPTPFKLPLHTEKVSYLL